LVFYDNGDVNLFSFDTLEDVKDFCTIIYKRIKEDPLGEFKLFCFYGNHYKFKMNPFRLCLDNREEILYEDDEQDGTVNIGLNEILKKYNLIEGEKLLPNEEEENT
jgi:hypothetical protein